MDATPSRSGATGAVGVVIRDKSVSFCAASARIWAGCTCNDPEIMEPWACNAVYGIFVSLLFASLQVIMNLEEMPRWLEFQSGSS